MIDDAELLRRYAHEGSQEAFAEIVERHVALVYGAAFRQVDGDAHRAQDVVQTVFTLLARRAGSLTHHPLLAGWLFVSTRHAAAKLIRAERRRLEREHKAYAMEEPADSDSARIDWERLRPVLDEVIHELKDVDREAILLRFFEQRPFEDVGCALQLSEEAARKRVDRALDKLRELLAARQITSTSAALGVVLAAQPGLALPAGFAASVSSTALASATAAGPALTLLRALASLKAPLGTAALALAVLIGVVHHDMRTRDALAADLLRTQQEINTRVAALREIESRLPIAEQAGAALAAQLTASETAPSPAAWDPVAEGKAFLAAHPEIKRAMIEHSRAKLNFRFASLYATLGLDAAQITQFQNLLRELEPGNESAGIDGKELVLTEGEGTPSGEVEAGLRALLGPEGYAAFTSVEQTRPARQLTFELAEALYFTDAPLDADRSEKLIRLMTALRSPQGIFDWDAILAQAETFLSAAQVPALRGLRAQDDVARILGFRWIGPLPAPSGTFVPAK